MDINIVRAFFMWCTVINAGLLIIAAVFIMLAQDRVYSMHSRWIPITRETFNTAIYCLLGFYKVVWVCFNLVPYIALVIAG